jgi:hypothetical protein
MTIDMKPIFIRMAFACAVVLATATSCTRTQTASGSRPAPVTKNAAKPQIFLETIRSVPIDTLIPTGPDIEWTPSGVPTKVIRRGRGTRHPTSDDGVILHSQIYDRAGHVVGRWDEFVGNPAKENDRIGWEMLQMMVEGEVRRIWRPDAKSPSGVMVADFELRWITPRPADETPQPTSTK